MLAEQLDRWQSLLTQEIERAREQDSNGSACCHRGNPGFVSIFEMICRKRAEASGERGAPLIGELIGMQFDGKPQLARSVEDPRGLLPRECDFLGEHVDCIVEALRSQCLEQRC